MKRYKMHCKSCGYDYEVITNLYEWERCPNCGYNTPFRDFVTEEREV
jgi:predicted RNA-binding Zn-ribbon protein involved in translation (DUF1610 family)